jgi:hypothetical protein
MMQLSRGETIDDGDFTERTDFDEIRTERHSEMTENI